MKIKTIREYTHADGKVVIRFNPNLNDKAKLEVMVENKDGDTDFPVVTYFEKNKEIKSILYDHPEWYSQRLKNYVREVIIYRDEFWEILVSLISNEIISFE